MIFAKADHIQQIIDGTKTMTRRKADTTYKVGKLYAIVPKRTAPGIQVGKIEILKLKKEFRRNGPISAYDAKKEGGYTPKKFEKLYEKMHPGWKKRTVCKFKFVQNPYLKYCDNIDCTNGGNRTVISTTILHCLVCGQLQRK